MHTLTDAGEARLETFLEDLGDLLGDKRRKASFATYALGLLGEGERKSVEPIAARAVGRASDVEAAHQRLLHFLARSEWDDRAVRRFATRYALKFMTTQQPIEACIIDDTGFLKQGTHSVGVQRQYTGSAGKIANCQVGVSLSLATRSDHLPVDFELYLPTSWTDDDARRLEAGIVGRKRVRRPSGENDPQGAQLSTDTPPCAVAIDSPPSRQLIVRAHTVLPVHASKHARSGAPGLRWADVTYRPPAAFSSTSAPAIRSCTWNRRSSSRLSRLLR